MYVVYCIHKVKRIDMRKYVYLLFIAAMFGTQNASAQASFTMDKSTASGMIPVYTDIFNYINNVSPSGITVDWVLYDHNLPQSWQDNAKFGMCDNITCYDVNVLKTAAVQTTDVIETQKRTMFKLQMDGSSSLVTPGGPYYIKAALSSGSTQDTVTFLVQKFATGVQKVTIAPKEEVLVYPNPAYNEVNVSFNKADNIKNIAIYSLVGKQISSFRNSNATSARLDIANIPAGLYLIKLMDESGKVVATRRFTHQ